MRDELNRQDIWARIAAPLPAAAISWRQDGRPTQRDGKFFARFVCYVDANTVRERLDSVVAGEWDLSLEMLPQGANQDGEVEYAFKGRLQILGVIREDVGTGKDYKSAATDTFKRCAVRFGVAHELYAYEQNWVQVDGDGRYAKPLEDPAVAYARRYGKATGSVAAAPQGSQEAGSPPAPTRAPSPPPAAPEGRTRTDGTRTTDEPECPKCGGRMWDNRLTKRNPKAPDFKCRQRSCDGAVWPERDGDRRPNTGRAVTNRTGRDEFEDFPGALADEDDDLPF